MTTSTNQSSNYDASGMDWLLGLYDQAFVGGLLNTVQYIYRDAKENPVRISVPCCFSVPERAYASMAQIITKSTGKNIDVQNVPRPFFSIYRSPIKLDDTRSVSEEHQSVVSLWDNATGQFHNDPAYTNAWSSGEMPMGDASIVNQHWPMPVNFIYKVDMWAKNRRHIDNASIQIMRKFIRKVYMLPVNFSPPVNLIKVPIFRPEITDTSALEPKDDNRSERLTFSFLVKAWIFETPLIVPPISTIQATLYGSTSVLASAEYDEIIINPDGSVT